jgi:diacylglycerol O-acyltransferase
MQKLAALDANFLYSESKKTPNHISSVQMFDLPFECNVDEFISRLKDYFMERIHLVPYLTRKLKFTPGNIDHPVWVEDPEFDLSNHFEQVKLPAPGSFGQLEEAVAEIHAELMDRNKPLWKLFLISGLEGGKIAYYNQAHHAAMDGMSGQAATMIMMDTSATPPKPKLAEVDLPENDSLSELLRLSFDNFMTFQINGAVQALNVADSVFRVAKRALDPNAPISHMPAVVLKTRFNRSIGKKRSYAAGEMSIANMKAVAKVSGGTVNDVLLATCAGGLRHYLLRTGELPAQTLVAGCPVSLRKPGDNNMDNKVSIMSVALSTDIEDARLRLDAVIDSSKLAKEVVSDTAPLQNLHLSWFGLPAMLTLSYKLSENLALADILPVPFNLIISNVPGPRKTLYSSGAKMLTHYPVSIPAHGLGLNITASSYVGNLYFSITSCAKAVPDAPLLRDDIMDSYEELMSTIIPFSAIEKSPTIRPDTHDYRRPDSPEKDILPVDSIGVSSNL